MLGRLGATYRSAFSGLARDVWLLAAAMLVNSSGTMVLPFLSLYATTQLGFATVEAGRLLTAWGAGGLLGAWAGGWLADRVGSPPILKISLFATGLGFLAIGQARGQLMMTLAVLATSSVAALFRPAMFAHVAAASEMATRPRSMALVRLAHNLGLSLGPALGGVLAMHHYGLLFVVDAVTCWLAAALLAATGGGRPREPLARRDVAESGSPWRNRNFLLFLGMTVLVWSVFAQLFSTFPIFLHRDYGLTEGAIGLLFTLNTLMIVSSEMLLVRRLERHNHLRVAAAGSLVLCVGFALLPLGSGGLFAAACSMVWTLGEMLTVSMLNTTASSFARPGTQGRYLGAYTLGASVAWMIAPSLGTFVLDRWGATVLWTGVGAFGIVLFAGFSALAPRFVRTAGGSSAG